MHEKKIVTEKDKNQFSAFPLVRLPNYSSISLLLMIEYFYVEQLNRLTVLLHKLLLFRFGNEARITNLIQFG